VKESEQVIDRYLELGGNFLDTANFYTKGHSEKIIGDHIGRHKDKRDRIVIATKFSGNLYPGDPNAAAPAENPSSPPASSRCGGCRPTTSICMAAQLGREYAHR
jgi:aryl-alcohol dehydrogenase-like predicted oxidoreductase